MVAPGDRGSGARSAKEAREPGVTGTRFGWRPGRGAGTVHFRALADSGALYLKFHYPGFAPGPR
jgi:hypothetical protein